MRKPNTKCKICQRAVYKRPFEIESYGENLYCSKTCMIEDRKSRNKTIQCPVCKKELEVKKNSKQIYCSKSCSGKITRNRTGTKKGYRKSGKNPSQRRLDLLRDNFGFKSCMVIGCDYNRVYHVHRLIEGKNGGIYEIGNMYAICPNHHAEYHNGLIDFIKITNSKLESREM